MIKHNKKLLVISTIISWPHPRLSQLKTVTTCLTKIEVGGEGGWDYLIADADAHRLYVSHRG